MWCRGRRNFCSPRSWMCLRAESPVSYLQVLSLRAEEVRVVSKTDIRTTERLHAAQLRGVTFEVESKLVKYEELYRHGTIHIRQLASTERLHAAQLRGVTFEVCDYMVL